jgi:GxxExxY protein
MFTSKKSLDDLSYKVMGAAIEVHRHLGPGLMESVYQKCLAIEFLSQDIFFTRELEIPIVYKDYIIENQFKCDFLVENLIVVELKSVSELLPIHHAQVINYINLLKVPKGILINFNVANLFHQGQKTFVNKHFDSLDPF